MRVRIMSCTEVVLDREAVHVTAEDPGGSLGIRPGHAPLVAPLEQSIVTVRTENDGETYVAVNGGVLVVTGPEVRIASRQAVAGTDMAHLEDTVLKRFQEEAEASKASRTNFERMRLDFMRRVLDFEQAGGLL